MKQKGRVVAGPVSLLFLLQQLHVREAQTRQLHDAFEALFLTQLDLNLRSAFR